jgi:hypothetical protein
VTGGATATRPAISAQGSDSNVGLTYNAKGSANHFFQTGGLNSFSITNAASQVNWLQASPSATGIGLQFSAQGSDTNIAQVFQSKGTGAIDLAAGSSGVNISNGGTVTAITRTAGGSAYATAPTVAISAPTTAGGVQATATVAVSAGAITTFTITNAGSGYVEQPTVSFSGGGGSGAAAYATVGSGTVVRGLGSTMDFYMPSGIGFSIADGGVTGGAYAQAFPNSTLNVLTRATGSGTNLGFYQISKGTGGHAFTTNSTTSALQFNVAHTASAVNYVQVTGSATSQQPVISAQGSDTNVGLILTSKGTSSFQIRTNNNNNVQMFVTHTASSVNWVQMTGAVAGSAPSYAVAGSDTNIDLTLTPKGTGKVRFGTFTTLGAEVITGYIEVKDSGGTVRKLAVIA